VIDGLRSWMTAVVAVSLLISAAQSLISKGAVQKVASVTGGLLLMIVLLSPLSRVKVGGLRLDFNNCSEQIGVRQAELEAEKRQELETLIAEKTQAYISDKAQALGISCTAVVTTRTGEDGIPYPYCAEMSCAPSGALSAAIAQELGIPEERQSYDGTSLQR